MAGTDGRSRAVIEGVVPELEGGRFPVKRTIGDRVIVEADVFCDGHDQLSAILQYRRERATWHEVPMAPLANDRWRGEFEVAETGRYHYRITAWVDHFLSWRRDLERRVQAEDIAVALQVGAQLAQSAAGRAHGDDAARLHAMADGLVDPAPLEERRARALDPVFFALMNRHPDRRFATFYRELAIVVDRETARFSTWYELFPRSCAKGGVHGTFRQCEARLPYLAQMGFDILYLPPIHPVGITKRKGRNNVLVAGAEDPGSPWAIGGDAGGHKAVHPELGTLDDFVHFVGRARDAGLEVAIDLAFQCSPDHPYVREHAEWFRHRPDGSIQFAENPPKRYEDIFPFDFETDAWRELWEELKDVVLFWIHHGIRIFRVDNPHTKPFGFWEWLIAEIKTEHPDVLFLAEAFARPKVMYRLAKAGFSQSYTYFTWRNTKWELTEYLRELTSAPLREYFRPNFWPNTPDILPEYLQLGGRPAFMARLVLAATLSPSYGIYGPAYELYESEAHTPGTEEYLDSEKYEIRDWELDRPDTLRDFISRVNRIRRENKALQFNDSLRFHSIDNDELIAYSKGTEGGENTIVVVVNLDPYHKQGGWLELPVESLGIDPRQTYQVHDLIADTRHLWHGERNHVQLDPARAPAHIFRVRRRLRREQDFEYFF